MVQGIVLRLLKWRDKYREKSAEMSPDEFVAFFCATHRGCQPSTLVTRICWRYLSVP